MKTLYLETYRHRLRHRPIRSDLTYLKGLKESLFELRLELVKMVKSKPWTIAQLDDVLRGLNPINQGTPMVWFETFLSLV